MRYTAWILTVGLLTTLSPGCSAPRMGLAKNEPPPPAAEERVQYGFPWGKQKDPAVANAPQPGKTEEMSAELAAKLAESRAANTKPAANLAETLRRAAAAEADGNLDLARAAYLEVVSKEPRHAEAHHRLGVIADMSRDSRTADEHYAQAYASNPKDADLLSDMGYSLYLRGRLDEAEVKLKDALQVNQYHRSAQTNLGLVYGKQGRYDDALAMFRQAGTESEAQRNLATLFPKGRPGSTTALASFEPGQAPPATDVTTATARSSAPPFPTDEGSTNSEADFEQAIRLAMQNQNRGSSQTAPPATPFPPGSSNPAGTTSANGQAVGGQPLLPGPSTTPSASSSDLWYGALGSDPATTPQPDSQRPLGTGVYDPGANPFIASTQPPASTRLPGAAPPSHNSNGMLTPAQWAAQMAVGTGPGSMFPRGTSQATPAQSVAPQSSLGIGFPGGAPANPWNTPLPAAGQSSSLTPPSSAVQPAYAEVPFGAAAQQAQNSHQNINWSVERPLDVWGSNSPERANNPTQTSNERPLSPPSPWNDVPQQAVWGDFATPSQGQRNLPTAAIPSQQGGVYQSAPAMNTSPASIPEWNGGAVPTMPANNGSYAGNAAGSAGNLPIVTPRSGTANAAQPASQGGAVVNPWGSSSPANSPAATANGTTTIPNWPYAPARP